MGASDSPENDALDERPLEAVGFYAVVQELDRRCDLVTTEHERRNKPLPEKLREQISLAKYAGEVMMHGNQGGKYNPTITLRQPWNLSDIIAIIGMPDDTEPSSDAAWRAVRRNYDTNHGGRAGGRTR